MSIQIGSRTVSSTTAERLYLQSANDSNLVNLQSARPETNLILQNFVLSRSNETLHIYKNATKLYSIDCNVATTYVPAVFAGNFTIQSNLAVAGSISAAGAASALTLTAAGVRITDGLPGAAAPTSNAVLLVQYNSNEILAMTSNGYLLLPTGGAGGNRIGIGTTSPQASIHTETDVFVRTGLRAGTLYTDALISATDALLPNPRSMRFATIAGQPYITMNGDLRVDGAVFASGGVNLGANVAADYVAALVQLSAPRFTMTTTASNETMVDWVYQGPVPPASNLGGGSGTPGPTINPTSNLVQLRIRPADSNLTAFAISRTGQIGIGTHDPHRALLDIRAASRIHSNVGLLSLTGYDGQNRILVDSNAGIRRFADAAESNHPFLALHSNTVKIGEWRNSGQLVLGLSNIGTLADTYSNAALIVDGDGQLNCIRVGCIGALSNTIDFLDSTIERIHTVRAANAVVGYQSVSNIVCDYLYTDNWEIPSMQCFDSNTYGLSEFHIRTSNLLFTGRQVFLDDTFQDISPYDQAADPRLTGKLLIRAAQAETGGVSRGLGIVGATNVSALIYSCNQVPTLELQNSATTARFGLDGLNQAYINFAGDAAKPFRVANTGYVYLTSSGGVQVAPTDRVGIGLGAAVPAVPLDLRGDFYVRTAASTPFFCAQSSTGNVGINTTAPVRALHVQGTSYMTGQSLMGSNLTVNNLSQNTGAIFSVHSNTAPRLIVDNQGNVGIGTTVAPFLLTVNGDFNLNGSIYQNGVPYVSSQWTTVGGSNLSYTAGAVGVGTTAPSERMHVVGNVFATGSFMSISDRRFKTDIQPMSDVADRVERLSGYTYVKGGSATASFRGGSADIRGGSRREMGLIAQELSEVFPELVAENERGELSVMYGNMAGVFVEAIKELRAEIRELRAFIGSPSGRH